MIYEPENVKGFRDYLPPESNLRNEIKRIARQVFELFGFQPVETPVLEYDELMRSNTLTEEDEAVRDRYRLKDRGGRNLGMRYEFTFQLSRLLKQNPNIKFPFKKYQIGENFRDEPIKEGRTRQFTQCDIDVIGDSSIKSDAECVQVMAEILKKLGIKEFEIEVNNRKLLSDIIDSVQIQNKEEVMRELDKLNKIGEDQVKANLRKYADVNQIISLFKLLEKPLEFFKKNAFSGAEELEELVRLCKNYGVQIKPNLFMIRGLGYYTGNIFEITKGKISLMGGGRYDNLVGKYLTKQIPAVGISFSVESLMGLCKEELSSLKFSKSSKVLLISLDQEKETLKLAQKIRKSEISCETFFTKPTKALEYANAKQIPFVVFIGEDEIKNKKFKLKDMSSGTETQVTEKQLISKLN